MRTCPIGINEYFLGIALIYILVRRLMHNYHFRYVIAFDEVHTVDCFVGGGYCGQLYNCRLVILAIDAHLQGYTGYLLACLLITDNADVWLL
jgi:hypothetical protein